MLRDKLDVDILPAFESLLHDACTSQVCVLPTCVCTITNLTLDNVIRNKLADKKELWKYIQDLIVSVEMFVKCLSHVVKCLSNDCEMIVECLSKQNKIPV